jgi:hypothetical protein
MIVGQWPVAVGNIMYERTHVLLQQRGKVLFQLLNSSFFLHHLNQAASTSTRDDKKTATSCDHHLNRRLEFFLLPVDDADRNSKLCLFRLKQAANCILACDRQL